jgi:RNA polymerase sigma-70 factor (ECF subfamily)
MDHSANNESTKREIEAARAGDAQRLGRLLESCRGYLMLVAARGVSGDLRAKGGASDVVQETLLGALRDFGAFHGGSHDELRAWLQKILRNNLAVFRRRYRGTQKRTVTREVGQSPSGPHAPWGALPDRAATPHTLAERRERSAELLAALERLSAEHRRVIVWRQYDQLTFEEIGRRLDRSADAARKLWSRALLHLSKALGPEHAP